MIGLYGIIWKAFHLLHGYFISNGSMVAKRPVRLDWPIFELYGVF